MTDQKTRDKLAHFDEYLKAAVEELIETVIDTDDAEEALYTLCCIKSFTELWVQDSANPVAAAGSAVGEELFNKIKAAAEYLALPSIHSSSRSDN